ncbi:ribonuclease H-like domain-containing protein [Tanacetum coccineum]
MVRCKVLVKGAAYQGGDKVQLGVQVCLSRGGSSNNVEVQTPNGSLPFTNDQIAKLMSLIGEKDNSGVQANMAGANQHITNSTKNITNVVDISELNITVRHPNGTNAKINHVGNLKLTNNVVLFDVLVILEYTVSLLSVNKMIKDSKLHVGFNEHDCVIQDLKKKNVLGTGSESGGLYMLAVWVYLIKSKDEVFGYFVDFVNLISNQFLKRIKVIRSDNGTEFINNRMDVFLRYKGIVHQTSYAYTPQQNGIAERKHRHLLNVARSLLFQGGIPLCFWIDCVLTATYLINKLPSSVLAGKSPFSMLYGKEASLSHLRFNNKNFFDLFESGHQNISSPNDDGEGPSDDAGEVIVDHQSTDTAEDNRTVDDNPVCDNIRRSSRMFKLPNKLNDFMLDNKVKYGLNRVVANGFGQKEGVDYEEIFSPVVKMSTAPRQWNKKLVETLTEAGFLQSKNDHSLFVKNKDGTFLALLVYVDDIIITGNNNDEISKFKIFLNQKFTIKDLGELKIFLGIEVLKIKNGLCLNQRKYCIELLHENGLLACKPVATPMPKNGILSHKETGNDKLLKNITSYQKIVGKLIYLCNTRPDIAYFVHCLSQHMHSPLQSHFEDALRVLRYLKSAPGAGTIYTKSSPSSIKAYADSDWAKCKMTRRSVSGYCVFVCGGCWL